MSKKNNRRAKAAPAAVATRTPALPGAAPDAASHEPPAPPVEAEAPNPVEIAPPVEAEAPAPVEIAPPVEVEASNPVEIAAPVEAEVPPPVDIAPRAAKAAKSGARKPAEETTGNGRGPATGQDRPQGARADIRGVLIQLAGARLLLPNATIAEVLSYAPPEPVEAAPDWLLGKIRWRGWQLPLVAFAELAGVGKEPAGLGSKVVVLKALGGNAKAPYFAILSQGFPRLVTVAEQGLVADPDSAALPLGVHSRVIMNEDTAFVPDLGAVEALITHALAEAA